MVNSIKYFEEECINRFEKLKNEFMKEPLKMAEYVIGLTEELHNLGLQMIQESLESMDMMIQKSPILSNWTAAKLRLKHKEGVQGSSTEGHVSHILSSRMSSRPMGWSITGATKEHLKYYREYFRCNKKKRKIRRIKFPSHTGACFIYKNQVY